MVLEGEALRERLMLEGDPTKHLFWWSAFPAFPAIFEAELNPLAKVGQVLR